MPVAFLGSHAESSSNIFQIVVVAQLEPGIRKDLSQSLFQSCPIIRHHDLQIVPKTFQLSKEAGEAHLILGYIQSTERNVVGEVVDPEKKGDLAIESLDRHILPIHHQDARETTRVAERFGHFLILREQREFRIHPKKHLFSREVVFVTQSSKGNTINVLDPKIFRIG